LSTGNEVSIRELVETIVRLCGYAGRVVFDASKPQGAPRRALDATRAKQAFGFEASTGLEAGLRATIDWYEGQAAAGTV
jgi:GDP-L-fucose synthase